MEEADPCLSSPCGNRVLPSLPRPPELRNHRYIRAGVVTARQALTKVLLLYGWRSGMQILMGEGVNEGAYHSVGQCMFMEQPCVVTVPSRC